MPVGTQASIKGLLSHQLRQCPIVLANTYHLAQRPGTEILEKCQGVHNFMNRRDGCILTDSGGFQMVSLLKLAKITESGVQFESPHDGSLMMLSPEESMKVQNAIGADIMMALDDVVPSTTEGPRVEEAMERTIRWIDRCIDAHKRPKEQNLFGIVQGGLDLELRKKCLEALVERDLPGYAIGGLSGGEDKMLFQSVVNLCTEMLPDNKPRYCMGVGYPEDLVVCVALGVDMFDCVYPCRTARFGTALVEDGTMKLKHSQFETDTHCMDDTLRETNKVWWDHSMPQEQLSGSQETTQGGSQPDEYSTNQYSRAYMNRVAARESAGCNVTTQHNIRYMMQLMKEMREAIREERFEKYVQDFFTRHHPKGDYPAWAVTALRSVNIELVEPQQQEVITTGLEDKMEE